jgi:hypothetical protein
MGFVMMVFVKKTKRVKRTVILLLVFTLFSSLAIAETGCFTYKYSPFFCSDIPREQAANECQLYGCNLKQTFYSERSCSEPDILKKCELSTIVDIPEELPAVPELIQELDEELAEETDEKEGTNYALGIGIIILFIALFIIYFIFKQNPDYLKTLFLPKKQHKKPSLNAIQKAPKWLILKDNSRLEKQKSRWKKKHQHKINEFHRSEQLHQFGPLPKQSVTREFRKLKGLVRTYKRRKKQIHKSNPEEHFAKLDQLTKEIKEKEQAIIQTHSQIDPKIIKKHELDNLMKDLKDISKGNN